MPSKPKEKELIPADDTPQWHVISEETDDPGVYVHRLLYGTKRQSRGHTPADLRRLREIADFCNKRGLAPRPKVLCKADQNLPVPKHTAITDDTYTAP